MSRTSDPIDTETSPRVSGKQATAPARTLAPPPLTARDTLAERAIRWILPWTVRSYPGLRRGIVELLGHRVTFSAVRGWRTERRTMPATMAELMADFIESRSRAGLALVDELRAYAATHRAKPQTGLGWQVVRERDGVGSIPRDGRGRFPGRRF